MVSLAEGFGFNTNLLETNILNLAVVLPLVFSLGKDTLTSILDNRREKILSSLRTADDRFKHRFAMRAPLRPAMRIAEETKQNHLRDRTSPPRPLSFQSDELKSWVELCLFKKGSVPTFK